MEGRGARYYQYTGISRFRSPKIRIAMCFNCTGTLDKLGQFTEHGLAAFILSCIFIQISFFN